MAKNSANFTAERELLITVDEVECDALLLKYDKKLTQVCGLESLFTDM